MASAKTASTTRRTASRNGSKAAAETVISPARWAGVALVIAAIVGAIALAMVSPSDPDGQPGVLVPAEPGPTPVPSVIPDDARAPTGQPTITRPATGTLTTEYDIDVGVDVPAEELKRRELTLVVLRDGREIGTLEGPKPDSKQTVRGVRLEPGVNVITAALQGPGGLRGPESVPVSVTVDADAPGLTLTAPRSRIKTFDQTVTVEGTSEAGAEVVITNEAHGFDSGPIVVGPGGTFTLQVPLKKGKNEIVAMSKDQAGQDRDQRVIVHRRDGKPKVELIAPKKIKRSTLPAPVKLVVEVTYADGTTMEGAIVDWSMTGDNRVADKFQDETGANGKSVWEPKVTAGSSLLIAVEVTSPYELSRVARRDVPIVP